MREFKFAIGEARDEILLLPVLTVNHEERRNESAAKRGRRALVGHLLAVDELPFDSGVLSAELLRPVHRPPALLDKLLLEFMLVSKGGVVIEVPRRVHRRDEVV